MHTNSMIQINRFVIPWSTYSCVRKNRIHVSSDSTMSCCVCKIAWQRNSFIWLRRSCPCMILIFKEWDIEKIWLSVTISLSYTNQCRRWNLYLKLFVQGHRLPDMTLLQKISVRFHHLVNVGIHFTKELFVILGYRYVHPSISYFCGQ